MSAAPQPAALQTAAGARLGPQPASEQLPLTVDRGHDEAGREEPREDAGGGQEAVGGRGHQPEAAATHGPGLQVPEVLTRHASRAVTRGAALVTSGLQCKTLILVQTPEYGEYGNMGNIVIVINGK